MCWAWSTSTTNTAFVNETARDRGVLRDQLLIAPFLFEECGIEQTGRSDPAGFALPDSIGCACGGDHRHFHCRAFGQPPCGSGLQVFGGDRTNQIGRREPAIEPVGIALRASVRQG